MKYTIVVSVYKDEEVLNNTLLRSPAIKRANKVMCQNNFRTVSSAYNAAIQECDHDLLVFVHPDVYLPYNWHDAFERSISWLQMNDPEWGVLGLYGVASDGGRHGFTYSTGIGSFLGTPFNKPKQVRTVDEFVFVLRKSSGLFLDEMLPTAQNHLAAADLCISAESKNRRSYVIPCFALHNSNRWSQLPLNFWKSYLYIRNKWRSALPIEAPYTNITKTCMPMFKSIINSLISRRSTDLRTITRVDDPASLYSRLCCNLSSSLGTTICSKSDMNSK